MVFKNIKGVKKSVTSDGTPTSMNYTETPLYYRETGWRWADILNLRYHNCFEQVLRGKLYERL